MAAGVVEIERVVADGGFGQDFLQRAVGQFFSQLFPASKRLAPRIRAGVELGFKLPAQIACRAEA